MFGPRGGLSLSTVIGSLSRTLEVVNQMIPIYKETRPMIQNARNTFNLIKDFGKNSTNKIMANKAKNIEPIKEKINMINHVNSKPLTNPTFFQ